MINRYTHILAPLTLSCANEEYHILHGLTEACSDETFVRGISSLFEDIGYTVHIIGILEQKPLMQ